MQSAAVSQALGSVTSPSVTAVRFPPFCFGSICFPLSLYQFFGRSYYTTFSGLQQVSEFMPDGFYQLFAICKGRGVQVYPGTIRGRIPHKFCSLRQLFISDNADFCISKVEAHALYYFADML